MRQFTDAEKQELQAKIEDEQERQKRLAEELAQQKDGPPRRSSTAGKYVYLGFVLCLLAFNVFILLNLRHIGLDKFGGLIFVLWALFDCIAVYFTKTGWQRLVMKTAARIWFIFMFAYGFWILAKVSIPLTAIWAAVIVLLSVWRISIWRPIFGKNSRYR